MCRTRVLSRSPAGIASAQVSSVKVTMPMPDMPDIAPAG
jgi:hypothetical protein